MYWTIVGLLCYLGSCASFAFQLCKQYDSPISQQQIAYLLLDGGRLGGNSFEDVWTAHVDAGIDLVSDKVLRLLHEAFDESVAVVNHDTILARILDLQCSGL
jgi:hypothetical protein